MGLLTGTTMIITFLHFLVVSDVERAVHLVPGVAYYVTVEACNGVFLCTRSTSASVVTDNSPPLPGLVHSSPAQGGGGSMYHSSR